jgi:hypothetical protein
MDNFNLSGFASQLTNDGARLDPQTGAVLVRPGIAVAFGEVDGQAAQIAARAIKATAKLAAAVDRLAGDPLLSPLGREESAKQPAAVADAEFAAADKEAAHLLTAMQAKLAEALVPPPLPNDQHGERADDREIRDVLRSMDPGDAREYAKADARVALAIVRGPRIGIRADIVDVAEGTRLQALQRDPAFRAVEAAVQQAQQAQRIIEQARNAARQVAAKVRA